MNQFEVSMNGLTVSKENQEAFLNNLRQQTKESHNHLEENYFSKAILEPTVSLANYQTYIAKLYGVVSACENDVFPAVAMLLNDVDKRHKSDLIRNDLQNTGLASTLIKNLPVHHFTFSSTAEALGIMYVLEGSTLGGKILYKHINSVLGFNAENGASYFWGYGPPTGTFWKTFITLLAAYAVEKNCEKEIISSAIQTFMTIDHWLNEAEIN